jgi:hypothetical protein
MTAIEDRVSTALRRLDELDVPTAPLDEVRRAADLRRRRMGVTVIAAAVALTAGAAIGVHAFSRDGATPTGPSPSPSPVTRADTWRRLGKVPLARREGATVARVGKDLVVFGGYRPLHCAPGALACPAPPSIDDGAVFEPATGSWRRMAPAPRGLAGGDLVTATGDGLIMLSNRGPLRIATYDVASDLWRVFPPPPVELMGNDLLAAGGGYAYVADQDDSADGTKGRVQRLDLATGRWDLLPPSTNNPRLTVRRLFITRDGLLMAGLHPLDGNGHHYRAEVEVLRDGHWSRYPDPDLEAAGYSFAWTGNRLVAPFTSDGTPGRSLDPRTSQWATLAAQPSDNVGGWPATNDSLIADGPLLLRMGVVYDAETDHSVVLTRPDGAPRYGSAGLMGGRVFVLDPRSRLWSQRVP